MKAYIVPKTKSVYLDPDDPSLLIPPRGWTIYCLPRPLGDKRGYEAEVIGLGTLANEVRKRRGPLPQSSGFVGPSGEGSDA